MGYAIYEIGGRDCGYGVPAYCEHPDCNKTIDRGLSYLCGPEPGYSDGFCDRYFCEDHQEYMVEDHQGLRVPPEKYEQSEEDTYTFPQCCERCRDEKEPFPKKPEHPIWVNHLLTDDSWKKWRENNPKKVKQFQSEFDQYTEDQLQEIRDYNS